MGVRGGFVAPHGCAIMCGWHECMMPRSWPHMRVVHECGWVGGPRHCVGGDLRALTRVRGCACVCFNVHGSGLCFNGPRLRVRVCMCGLRPSSLYPPVHLLAGMRQC